MSASSSAHCNSPESESADFGARVKAALLWRSGSQMVAQLVMWASTLLVIRILNPEDYGLFAMTQVVMALLVFLNGYGFASALVQSESVNQEKIRQAFGLLILLNGGIAVAQFLSAPLVAGFYDEPRVTNLLRVQSLIYLATPFIALPEVLMSRTLEFRKQAVVNLVAALSAAVVSLVCALAGLGVWTLVIAPIAMFWIRAIGLTVTARMLVRPSFRFTGMGQMFGFGSALLVSHVFWTIQVQADVVIAGRMLDAHMVGIYAEALFIVQLFSSKFIPPINDVAFPAYSRLQNDPEKLRQAFLKSLRVILAVACPVYFGLAAVAEPFVGFVFGEKWLEMARFIQIIAFVMPFMTVQIIWAPLVNALGRPQNTMQTSIAGAMIMPLAFYFAIEHGGAIGLAWAWVIGVPCIAAFAVVRSQKLVGIGLLDIARAGLAGFMAALVMAVIVWSTGSALAAMAIPGWLGLGISIALGVLVYGLAFRLIWPNVLREMIALVIKKKMPVAA